MPTLNELRGLLKKYTKPIHRQWKWVWQEKGQLNEPKLVIPKVFEEKNLEIIDPLHPQLPTETPWISPTRHPMFEYLVPKPKREQHPLYHHNKSVFLFDEKTKLHAGVDQACILTKTVPFYNLPESFNQNINKITIPNQDQLVQSYIRQAIAYDATKEELPNKYTPLKQRRTFKREWSIPRHRQMSILLENMLGLCESVGSKYPELFQRNLYQNTPFYTTYQRADEIIHIRKKNQLIITNPQPLKPVVKRLINDEGWKRLAEGEQILSDQLSTHDPDLHYLIKANDYQFLNMYPIYPTIDLEQEHLYQEGYELGWNQRVDNKQEYLHTFYYVSFDELIHESSIDERLAQMVMFSFGNALAQAQHRYPDGVLTEPVTVQGIFMLDELFHFVIYQLNTMNFSDDESRVNYVWIDKNNYLYADRPSMVVQNPRYGTERNLQRYVTEHLKYNPDVFQKLLTFYLQGVGIPGIIILIGLLGYLAKFFIKRCRKKAWVEITSMPKSSSRKTGTEREPLQQTHGGLENSTASPSPQPDGSPAHIVIPVDESDFTPAQLQQQREQDHTIVEITRSRLNRMKQEDFRTHQMINPSPTDGIQKAIAETMLEFDASV
ncbi:unnamed protein product [Didymodactylos carnosus]|uniref:Large ribosomal subunit protein mL37 n=1 Tax=Didymodactylos carnosus TaxID=1234261 RepID=A0A814DZN8_9BILA|nr:unnamed protein product [Didymodactylos carnosus]CAF0962642.1 unnamed protein product [Didymodactylos carnosus]CAF3638632.1 unnamed protein product [Didymodactylos carnosus]CAF3737037.1 unnamed protein product [Didymodactylos carnosus]